MKTRRNEMVFIDPAGQGLWAVLGEHSGHPYAMFSGAYAKRAASLYASFLNREAMIRSNPEKVTVKRRGRNVIACRTMSVRDLRAVAKQLEAASRPRRRSR